METREMPAEQVVGRSERRLSVALGAADIVGIWDGDLVAGLVYGDANFARLYGVDPETAARGVPRGGYLKNIHPDDVAEVRAEMERLYAGAAEYANEHRILHPQGVRWVLTRGRLVRDALGKPLRFAGVSVDITDRKRAEGRQALLLNIVDRLRNPTASRGILGEVLAMLGRHLGANRVGYGQMKPDDTTIVVETGYAEGVPPLVGTFPLAYFGLHTAERHRQGLTVVCDDIAADARLSGAGCAGGPIRAFVSVPLVREGRLRATLFASYCSPQAWRPDDVALIEDVAGRIWDTLERARSEEALHRFNASLEKQIDLRTRELDRIWQLAPVLMVVGTPDGTLLKVNPAWTRILGWQPAETIGRNILEFVAPEDGNTCMRPGSNFPQVKFLVEQQHDFITQAGERRRIGWTVLSENDCLYGYGRDVTDQVVAEAGLRQMQKMEAVGQLTGGLAHDFNNLLMGISGSLELLQSRLAEGRFDDCGRYIDTAQGAARRAAALTQRLLAFSRRQTLDPRPTDVNRLIAGMAELVRRTIGPALDLRVIAAPTLWTARVDANQLENALLNLCINARDAMPDGGRLTIETANHDLDAAAARSLDLAPGHYLSLCVTDTGIGMTAEVMRRAFDPFFTTKPLGVGTGLGLSMIYGFVRQSGGHVHLRSEIGRGSAVSLYLPRHVGDEAATAQAPGNGARPASSGSRRSETVLVVDDEAMMRMLLSDALQELGYTPIEAPDGAAGLKLLESDGRIDLLVTDVGLPGGLNGRQLADAGRDLRPGLRVLFITGYAESAVFKDRPLAPGMQLLIKPFTLDALSDRIAAMLAAPEASS